MESSYNAINRNEIPGYKEFSELFKEEYEKLTLEGVVKGEFPSPKLLKLAKELVPLLAARESDYDTSAADGAVENQAIPTGQHLNECMDLPGAIYVSPYKRTRQTLEGLLEGWPELKESKIVEDDRIREQEYGKSIIYNDKRLYFVFNPEYAVLHKFSTGYEYKHEGGESLLDVRSRLRDFVAMIIREHGGTPEDILIVTHNLAIMALRANLERWTREEFLDKNANDRPPNCSLTKYKAADTGRLELEHENLVLY